MVVNPEVTILFESYPKEAKEKLYRIRKIIFAIAEEEDLGEFTESLKWGEASYACTKGSPIRIDWKAKQPQNISIYFNCKTSLIETYRALMGERLNLIGNREIRFELDQPLPLNDIRLCCSLALRYHRIKHLPMLGL